MEKTPKSQTRVFFLAENGLTVRQRHLRWSKALTLDHLEVGVTANGVLFLLLQFFGHVIGRWYWVQQTQMLLQHHVLGCLQNVRRALAAV